MADSKLNIKSLDMVTLKALLSIEGYGIVKNTKTLRSIMFTSGIYQQAPVVKKNLTLLTSQRQ